MLQLRDNRYNDIRLIFEEKAHKYYDTLGNDFISTTTLLHKLQPKFDKDYWLKKKAKEYGMSTARLEDKWNSITKEACDRGNVYHNSMEDGIRLASQFKSAVKYMKLPNGQMITVADLPNINMHIKELNIAEFIDSTENKFPEVYNIFQRYINNGYKIYSEIGVFLIDYLISGTIDVLLVRDDKFVIGDWKTNRGGLQFTSGYYKKDKSTKPAQETNEWIEKDERLLPPLAHLQNCNGNIYNLQLSMYAKMVEIILGIPCACMWLCHIDSDFILNDYGRPKRFDDLTYKVRKNSNPTTKIHVMKYLSQDIDLILKERWLDVQATKISSNTLF